MCISKTKCFILKPDSSYLRSLSATKVEEFVFKSSTQGMSIQKFTFKNDASEDTRLYRCIIPARMADQSRTV